MLTPEQEEGYRLDDAPEIRDEEDRAVSNSETDGDGAQPSMNDLLERVLVAQDKFNKHMLGGFQLVQQELESLEERLSTLERTEGRDSNDSY